MDKQPQRKVFVGIIRSPHMDSRILVTAVDEEEAMVKVLEKSKDSAGVYFQTEDVTIVPFSEVL